MPVRRSGEPTLQGTRTSLSEIAPILVWSTHWCWSRLANRNHLRAAIHGRHHCACSGPKRSATNPRRRRRLCGTDASSKLLRCLDDFIRPPANKAAVPPTFCAVQNLQSVQWPPCDGFVAGYLQAGFTTHHGKADVVGLLQCDRQSGESKNLGR